MHSTFVEMCLHHLVVLSVEVKQQIIGADAYTPEKSLHRIFKIFWKNGPNICGKPPQCMCEHLVTIKPSSSAAVRLHWIEKMPGYARSLSPLAGQPFKKCSGCTRCSPPSIFMVSRIITRHLLIYFQPRCDKYHLHLILI